MLVPHSTLLAVTRWVIIATMGFAMLAAIGATFGACTLAFFGPEAAAMVARHHPGIDVAQLRPLLLVLLCLVVPLIAIAIFSLRKLLAIVSSVRDGDPFTRENAVRLRAMGWLMVALQVGTIPVGIVAAKVASHFERNHLNFDMSMNGLLATLLVFVLAGVFEQGAAMREELEGTV